MNIRQHIQHLAKLGTTGTLEDRLPMTDVIIEEKHDGHRYTLQVGGSSRCWFVSRSGAVAEPDSWMVQIHDASDQVLLFDGEYELATGNSTAAEVSRADTEKRFVVFDLLQVGDKDLRDLPLSARRELARDAVAHINHERLVFVDGFHCDKFDHDDLHTLLHKINSKRNDGIALEGYVVKRLSMPYSKTYGYKVKLTETEDAIVMAMDNGAATVGQISGGKCWSVGVVPIPDSKPVRVMDVIEFDHLGWTGRGFRSPRFVSIRTDKPASECHMMLGRKPKENAK